MPSSVNIKILPSVKNRGQTDHLSGEQNRTRLGEPCWQNDVHLDLWPRWRQPGFATSNIVSLVEATEDAQPEGWCRLASMVFCQSPRSSVRCHCSPTAIRADRLLSIGLLLLIDSTSTTDDARELEARQNSSLCFTSTFYYLLHYMCTMIVDV